MKLIVVLSLIAYGYAEKLDRTYLPPVSAATAGGSPGALTAPNQLGSTYQQGQFAGPQPGSLGLPKTGSTFQQSQSASGPQQGSLGFTQTGPTFQQGQSTSGPLQGSLGFPQTGSTLQQSQSASGPQQGSLGFSQTGSAFQQGPSTSGFQQGGLGLPQTASGFVQGSLGNQPSVNGFVPSNNGASSGNVFGGSVTPISSYGPLAKGPSGQTGFVSPQIGSQNGNGQATGALNQGFNQGAQVYSQERPQAAADRNAEILKYINENNIESYNFSYETSNGISAEENGEASNGVRAQGGYSYTGDDGKSYSITYTADENGYQPQGEHLPTPHPIPEEILRSIEENARAAAAGTQEGAYRPEEYESEVSQQQYSTGISAPNGPVGQNLGSAQGFLANQGQVINAQNNQYSTTNQGPAGQGFVNGQSGQANQGSTGLFNGNTQSGVDYSKSVQGQGQGSNGYKYSQPQGTFGSTGLGQVSLSQNGQKQASFPGSPSIGSASNNYQGSSGVSSGNVPTFGTQAQYQNGLPQTSGNLANGQGSFNQGQSNQSPFGTQTQYQGGVSQSTFGNQANGQGSSLNQGNKSPYGTQTQYQVGLAQSSGNQPTGPGSLNQAQNNQAPSSQGSGSRGNQQFGSTGSSGQGYQYQPNANQNAIGINGANQGAALDGAFSGQGAQNKQGNKQSLGTNIGSGPNTLFAGNRNTQSNQNGNQPIFGSNQGPNKAGSSFNGSNGSQTLQASYQYNRPDQSFGNQQQNTGSVGSNGNNGSQGTEQFGGPRQPPSFSPEEGYKY